MYDAPDTKPNDPSAALPDAAKVKIVQHTNPLHARVRRKEFNLTARQYKKRLKDMRRGAANKIYSVITKEPA